MNITREQLKGVYGEEDALAIYGEVKNGKADEMLYWTKEEFNSFIEAIIDKRESYLAFMIMYWTGVRIGELLALTPMDIDLENNVIHINKSYQRLNRKDVITEPKTPRSIRDISIPDFLAEDISDYLDSLYNPDSEGRIFPFTKHFLENEMKRGCKESGVKKIRIHDLRHSHASLLVSLGFSPVEISDRLGHEKIETTIDTYSHLYPETRTAIANKLNEKYKESL